MRVVLRVVAVLLLAGGMVVEVAGSVAAPGVVLILGLWPATSTRFLVATRCAPGPPRGMDAMIPTIPLIKTRETGDTPTQEAGSPATGRPGRDGRRVVNGVSATAVAVV